MQLLKLNVHLELNILSIVEVCEPPEYNHLQSHNTMVLVHHLNYFLQFADWSDFHLPS